MRITVHLQGQKYILWNYLHFAFAKFTVVTSRWVTSIHAIIICKVKIELFLTPAHAVSARRKQKCLERWRAPKRRVHKVFPTMFCLVCHDRCLWETGTSTSTVWSLNYGCVCVSVLTVCNGNVAFLFLNNLIWFNRVKNRADIIGAFKVDPLYLKHENQESGKISSLQSTFEITITGNISRLSSRYGPSHLTFHFLSLRITGNPHNPCWT